MSAQIFQIDGSPDEKALDAVVPRLVRGLTLYPYFVIVEGFDVIEDTENIQRLTRLLSAVPGPEGAVQPDKNIALTRVESDLKAGSANAKAGEPTQTIIEHPPHTDSSFMEVPHELVGFQMVRADPDGGKILLIPIEDILRGLDDFTTQLLAEPVYPHGDISQSIIYGSHKDLRICYYAQQLRSAVKARDISLKRANGLALSALDLLISEQKDVHSHELQPGQILFMNNTKLLHSNTSYSPESDRLVYRIRQYVPALSAANTIAKLTEEQLPQNSKDTPDNLDKLSENVAFGAIDSSVVERVMSEESVDRAIKFCDAFLKENPNDPTALVLQARVYDSHNRQKDALRPLELARKAQPNNPDVLKAYGRQLIRVGEFVEAKDILEKFHRLNPADHSGNVDYSAVLNKLGERKQAREILEQLIGNHPIQKASIGSGGKATVLRLRGLQSASFEIVHNERGYYEAELRSGHFATDELFKEQNYEMIVFNILNDNLNRVEKLPNCDIILNTVSCPDLERKSLMTIASFTDRFPDVPLVNCARQVLQTTRDRASQRMQGVEGVHYPQSERIIWRGGSPEDVYKNLSALGFRCPIILRPININSSAGVRRIDNQADIALYFANAKAGSAHYAIQYEDLRGPHGLYNRLRMFCIDGNFYPSSNMYSDNWMLDEDDRYTTMMSHSWTQLEEMTYLDDPIAHLGSEAYMRLRRIRDVVGLDFFGIDFHLLPDGELFVFRISASMHHSFDHVADFPYAEPHQQRISNAFDTMMRRRFKKGPEAAEPQLPMVAAE